MPVQQVWTPLFGRSAWGMLPNASPGGSSVDSGGDQYVPPVGQTLISLNGTTHPVS